MYIARTSTEHRIKQAAYSLIQGNPDSGSGIVGQFKGIYMNWVL